MKTTYKILMNVLPILAMFITTSIVQRHDVDVKKYTALANNKAFDCVGLILRDNDTIGCCVLINKDYALTAAHVFINSEIEKKETEINGHKSIVNMPVNKIIDRQSAYTLRFKNREYKVKSFSTYDNYDIDNAGENDLAVIKLEDEAAGIATWPCNSKTDEQGMNVVAVGYGASGLADAPEDVGLFGLKLAGENVIDTIWGIKVNNISSIISADMDHPTRTDCNQFGSETPLPVEGLPLGGDSGSGLFSKSGNGWTLVGICSGGGTDITTLLKSGYYGQTNNWTRLSAYSDWIKKQTRK